MKRLVLFFLVVATLCAIGLTSMYFRFKPPAGMEKGLPLGRLTLENFETGAGPSRNSGTWIKRDGRVSADRIAFNEANTVLRLTYDVKEDGGKFKEAGWWCSLSGMDLRRYSAIRFRVALSNRSILFQIGFKNVEWVEQKVWSESHTRRSTPPGEWQEITIPLKEFHKIDSWSAMDNFSITFRSNVGNVAKGEVFLDDFVLVPGGTALPFPTGPTPALLPYPIPAEPAALPDEVLLELVQRAAFEYFLHEVNPENGLVKDFCRANSTDHLPVASSAAVGFGLSSLCVGASRGWVPNDVAQQRILSALRFFRNQAQEEHGFFYHFMDIQTGTRWAESEISSVDTALLLAGMITAANCFPGGEIEKLTKEIVERVDWPWMMAGGKTLSMGWTPEDGFLQARWSDYCELMIIYLLAIGSPSHPIAPETWYEWSRLRTDYDKDTFIGCPPLFTHQYSHAWVDFRGMHDEEANYFSNSIHATQANQKWCMANKEKFRTYREGFWGLTACDGPTGYMAYGAPYGVDDGTVAPTAAIASIVFTPTESIAMMRLMLSKWKDKLWGRYGFIDAFNLEKRWFSNKYLGIDQGPIVLMIENYRTGLVWKTFMKSAMIQKALAAAKFQKD